MNARVAIMTQVSDTAVELSRHAHTAYWVGCSGKTDTYLDGQIERDFERLANLLGYDIAERPKASRFHQTNTLPSERGLSADDRADIAYDESRDAREAAE